VQVGSHFPPPARDVPVRMRDFCLDLEERQRHLGAADAGDLRPLTEIWLNRL